MELVLMQLRLSSDWRTLGRASPGLRRDREVVLAAVKIEGFALKYAAPELRGDKAVVLAAVTTWGTALEFAAPELRADREVVLAAVAQCGDALWFAAKELQGDREVVLAAVKSDADALEYAAPELRRDREVVLAAIAKEGRALEHAAWELRQDREVVMAAVANRGRALQYASAKLRGDPDVVLAAGSEAGYALEHAAPELQADREVVLAAVGQDRRALQWAAPELKLDREFVREAMERSATAKEDPWPWKMEVRRLIDYRRTAATAPQTSYPDAGTTDVRAPLDTCPELLHAAPDASHALARAPSHGSEADSMRVKSVLQELRGHCVGIGEVILFVTGQMSVKDQKDLVRLAKAVRKDKVHKDIVVVHKLAAWSMEMLNNTSSEDGLSYKERIMGLFGLADKSVDVTIGGETKTVTVHEGLLSSVKVLHYYMTNDRLDCSINRFAIQDIHAKVTVSVSCLAEESQAACFHVEESMQDPGDAPPPPVALPSGASLGHVASQGACPGLLPKAPPDASGGRRGGAETFDPGDGSALPSPRSPRRPLKASAPPDALPKLIHAPSDPLGALRTAKEPLCSPPSPSWSASTAAGAAAAAAASTGAAVLPRSSPGAPSTPGADLLGSKVSRRSPPSAFGSAAAAAVPTPRTPDLGADSAPPSQCSSCTSFELVDAQPDELRETLIDTPLDKSCARQAGPKVPWHTPTSAAGPAAAPAAASRRTPRLGTSSSASSPRRPSRGSSRWCKAIAQRILRSLLPHVEDVVKTTLHVALQPLLGSFLEDLVQAAVGKEMRTVMQAFQDFVRTAFEEEVGKHNIQELVRTTLREEVRVPLQEVEGEVQALRQDVEDMNAVLQRHDEELRELTSVRVTAIMEAVLAGPED